MKKKRFSSLLSVFLALVGVLMVGSVVYPVIQYQIQSGKSFQEYLSPVPEEPMRDYTKPATWFPTEETASVSNVVKFYNLSVPKLGIKSAVVSIGGEDLSDSLIQYPGTALPGKRGNTVVFGHSVLPSFFDPKDYLTIFSTLPTMKKQDEIQVEYDGISYTYKVQEIFEVLPTDLEVLSQNADSSYISLITCVPPGDPRRPKRLIVRARLIPPTERSFS